MVHIFVCLESCEADKLAVTAYKVQLIADGGGMSGSVAEGLTILLFCCQATQIVSIPRLIDKAVQETNRRNVRDHRYLALSARLGTALNTWASVSGLCRPCWLSPYVASARVAAATHTGLYTVRARGTLATHLFHTTHEVTA